MHRLFSLLKAVRTVLPLCSKPTRHCHRQRLCHSICRFPVAALSLAIIIISAIRAADLDCAANAFSDSTFAAFVPLKPTPCLSVLASLFLSPVLLGNCSPLELTRIHLRTNWLPQ